MKEKLKIDEWDTDREKTTPKKLVHFLRVMTTKKATNALESVWEFQDINFEKLWNDGKRGIILDVDECIAPHHWQILPENMKIIKELLDLGWKIVIFSNMKKSDRYDELEALGVRIITSEHAKPDERWFTESQEALELELWEILMIWDNYLTDGGAIYAGIEFIKVAPIKSDEIHKSLKRRMQITFRTIADFKAGLMGKF